jgi:PEP-CTERM motif
MHAIAMRLARWSVKAGMTICVISVGFSSAQAGTTAITFSTSPTDFQVSSASARTEGWQFTTSQAINVTALGFWDAGGDGLINAHDIGIFNTSSTLLVSGTVPLGTMAPLATDDFRYVTLSSSFLLEPGTYSIGATYFAGAVASDHAAKLVGPVAAPGITYEGSYFAVGEGLTDPKTPSANVDGIFGPNFQFTGTSVPEPSSLVLGGIAALMGLGLAWRRRRSG